ncbi:MAG: helix-turn-helix domain-containing protein [Nanoarchaeota archaeon]
MEQEILEHIGLTISEKKVYLALLETGDATRGEIVKRSGVAGSKVYELLEKLLDKGLASMYLADKVKHFKPANPYQILNVLEEKKSQLATLEKETKLVLPMLLAKFNASKEEQEVELFSGLHGLEIIFREQVEIMKKGEACYVIGGTRGSDEASVQAFFEKIHVMREQKGIRTKMLFNVRQKESTERLYSSRKYPKTETRYIQHASPVAINIYKNRTVIIIFGRQISAIHITSQDVANSFLEYFQILWKVAKK